MRPLMHLIYPGNLQSPGARTWGCRAETSACFSLGGSQEQILGGRAQGATVVVPSPGCRGLLKLYPPEQEVSH